MLARLRSLRNISIRKDVSVQLGQMDHASTEPGHPYGGRDLMSDERRPDWFPMFFMDISTGAIIKCGSGSFEIVTCLLTSPLCTEAWSLMTPVFSSWNSLRPCS